MSFNATEEFALHPTPHNAKRTDIEETVINYSTDDNYLDSLYGAGGYVFIFDRENKRDRATGLSVHDVLDYDWAD